jgi:hypothetical protein
MYCTLGVNIQYAQTHSVYIKNLNAYLALLIDGAFQIYASRLGNYHEGVHVMEFLNLAIPKYCSRIANHQRISEFCDTNIFITK